MFALSRVLSFIMEFIKANATSSSVTFITQVYAENHMKPIITTTIPIKFDLPPLRERDFVKFVIKESHSKQLYHDIISLEEKVIDSFSLMYFDDDFWKKLPLDVQTTLNQNRLVNCFRSNYFYGDDEKYNKSLVMFLKGNIKNLKIFQNGEAISIEQLGPGYYHFKINGDTLYCGPHGKPQHVINLMLRIIEINYEPFSENSQDNMKRKMDDMLPPAPSAPRKIRKKNKKTIRDDDDVISQKTLLDDFNNETVV